MAHDGAPRRSHQEYFRYGDQAALRNPATDLSDALYAHQERLAAREHTLRLEVARRAGAHAASPAERPTAARQSVREGH